MINYISVLPPDFRSYLFLFFPISTIGNFWILGFHLPSRFWRTYFTIHSFTDLSAYEITKLNETYLHQTVSMFKNLSSDLRRKIFPLFRWWEEINGRSGRYWSLMDGKNYGFPLCGDPFTISVNSNEKNLELGVIFDLAGGSIRKWKTHHMIKGILKNINLFNFLIFWGGSGLCFQNDPLINILIEYRPIELEYKILTKRIQYLLKSGCNVNIKNSKGETPLLLALKCPINPRMIRLLLQYGADPMTKNSIGKYPLQLIIEEIDSTKNKKTREELQQLAHLFIQG